MSTGDAVEGSSLSVTISVLDSRSGPIAFSIMARTSSPRWPGSVRTSTWSSTRSGMMFVFTPPRATVGANVVWVAAWTMRARLRSSECEGLAPGVDTGRIEQQVGDLVREIRAAHEPLPDVVDPGLGTELPSRRMTSAALMSALSVRNGIDAWLGEPWIPDRAPVAALLRHHHRQHGRGVGRDLQPRPARLGEGEVDGHRIASVVSTSHCAPWTPIVSSSATAR